MNCSNGFQMEHNYPASSAGVEMPRIIYGTAWKEERTADLVYLAVKTGFRGIDTAGQPKHYNEPLVGQSLRRLTESGIRREDLFLQTKFTPLAGQDPARVPYDPDAPAKQQVAQSFRTSTQNLGTPYVDSLVLHSPVAPYELLMEVWTAMEKIHAAGGARQLGISNCYDTETLAALHEDAVVKPAVVQNRFYPGTGYDAGLRAWCAGSGVVYQGFWTLTANPHVLNSGTVRSVARKHDKTEAQVFFRYLTQIDVVPLTGTTSERHMKEDLEIFGFDLDAEELEAVDRMLGKT